MFHNIWEQVYQLIRREKEHTEKDRVTAVFIYSGRPKTERGLRDVPKQSHRNPKVK